MKTSEPFVRLAKSNMSEHRFRRPPIAFTRQRSISVCSELEREPTLQMAPLRKRQESSSKLDILSSSSMDDRTTVEPLTTADSSQYIVKQIETTNPVIVKKVVCQSLLSSKPSITPTLGSQYEKSIQPKVRSAQFQKLLQIFENQVEEPCSEPVKKVRSPTPIEPMTNPPSEVVSSRKIFIPIPITPPALTSADVETEDESQSNPSRSSTLVSEPSVENEQKTKLRRTLEEVYNTEKNYTDILFVLTRILPRDLETVRRQDKEVWKNFDRLFRPLIDSLKAIYELHHHKILLEFELCLSGHRLGLPWTVLEQNFQAIQRLYERYYVVFSETQQKLDQFVRTQPLISEAMLKTQIHLGKLCPMTQLNCANQRLTRYIILIASYMKALDRNSSDYEHAQFILDELDRITHSCDEAIAVAPSKFQELKSRLDNKGESFKRQNLLWHGALKKRSPRKFTDITGRYLILVSDFLVICRESGSKLEIKQELSLKRMTIQCIDNPRLPANAANEPNNAPVYFPFQINAVEKSSTFLADSEATRKTWMRKIQKAIDDSLERSESVEIRRTKDDELGTRAPLWIPDVDVTRCQQCHDRFRLNRKHHCRACGQCVCGPCSTKKILLNYCPNEDEVRVCDRCYTHFTGVDRSKYSKSLPLITRKPDQTILFGDFHWLEKKTVVWVALEEDYQLHFYGGKLDQVEESTVSLLNVNQIKYYAETRRLELQENSKTHVLYFQYNHQSEFVYDGELDDELKRAKDKLEFYSKLWIDVLNLARERSMPDWYKRKRDSQDSGVSECSTGVQQGFYLHSRPNE